MLGVFSDASAQRAAFDVGIHQVGVAAKQANSVFDAGDRASGWLVFGEVVVVGLAGYYAATLLTARWPRIVQIAVGLACVVLIASFVISSWVPVAGDHPTSGPTQAFPNCGPGGIPTWWPRWLPS